MNAVLFFMLFIFFLQFQEFFLFFFGGFRHGIFAAIGALHGFAPPFKGKFALRTFINHMSLLRV